MDSQNISFLHDNILATKNQMTAIIISIVVPAKQEKSTQATTTTRTSFSSSATEGVTRRILSKIFDGISFDNGSIMAMNLCECASARFSHKNQKSTENVKHNYNKDDGIFDKNSRQLPIALLSKAALNLKNNKMYPFTPTIQSPRTELSSIPRIIFEDDVLSAHDQSSIRSDSAESCRDLLEIRGYRNFLLS